MAPLTSIGGQVNRASLGHESISTTLQSYAKPEAVAGAKQRRVISVLTDQRPSLTPTLSHFVGEGEPDSVELNGIEPSASSMPLRRSPS